MKTFKAEYEITLQGENGSEKMFECAKNGYASVEALKAETQEVVESMILTKNIPDGEMLLEMRISTSENGVESYYDHDEATIRVADGKIAEFLE